MRPSELLAKPESWTRRVWARREDGQACWPNNPEAVCWCIEGAVQRCYPIRSAQIRALGWIWKAILETDPRAETVILWQDQPGRTHDEVLKVLIQAGE